MIKTLSSFIYGFKINEFNDNLVIQESGNNIYEITIPFGGYSGVNLATAIQSTLNSNTNSLNQSYSVIYNTTTKLFTISSSGGNFSLIIQDPSYENTIWETIGFLTDKTLISTATGDNTVGKEWRPQFPLQKYHEFETHQRWREANVNTAASGTVEIVAFGRDKFSTFNILYITNQPQSTGSPIENNPTALEDAIAFMEWATEKGTFEFLEDRDDPSNFTTCDLSSTTASSKGIDFEIKEMYSVKLANYYQTGKLKIRKATT